MQPYAVVEAYDVVSYVRYCFTVAGIVLLPDTLHFQVQKETLHNGVVPAVAFATHAANQAVFFQQRLMLATCLLRAPV